MYYLGKKNKSLFRMTAAAVIIALASSCVFPGEGYAARSNAGGGKIAEVDWGDVGDNVGKTIGTALIGGALSSAWSTAAPINQSTSFFGKLSTDIMNIPQTFGNLLTNTAGNTAIASTPLSAAFSSLTNLETVAPIIIKGYTTYTAGTQVVKAIGMAGQYNEWNPSTTYALSYMGAGMTAGLLNPNAALGKNFNDVGGYGGQMLKGMLVGGLGGYATGATIYSIDGDKIKEGKSPGTGAQIAGMATGMVATEFGRTLLNPKTYKNVVATFEKKEVYDFRDSQQTEPYKNMDDFNKTGAVDSKDAIIPGSPEEQRLQQLDRYAEIMRDSYEAPIADPKDVDVGPIEAQELQQPNPQAEIRSLQDPSLKIAQGEGGGLEVQGKPLTYKNMGDFYLAVDNKTGAVDGMDAIIPGSPEEAQKLQQLNPQAKIRSLQDPSLKITQGEGGGLEVIQGKPLGQYYVRSDVKDTAKYTKTYKNMGDFYLAVDNKTGAVDGMDAIIPGSPEEAQKLQQLNPQAKIRSLQDPSLKIIGSADTTLVLAMGDAKGDVFISPQDLSTKAGTKNFELALKANGKFGQDTQVSSTTVSGLLNSDRANVSGGGGGAQISIDGKPPLKVDLTEEQYAFASNLRQGLEPDSLYLPTGKPPTGGQIASRIFIDPFVKTADQWPAMATRALALNAYKQIDRSKDKDHQKWAPLVSEVVFSTAYPLLDSAANIWGLKPSLVFNTDEKFGYLPESKYQQAALFKNATVLRVATETAKLPPNAREDKIKEALAKLGINSEAEQKDIIGKYNELKDKIVLQDQKQFEQKDQTKALSKLIMDKVNTNSKFNNELDRLKGVGGSEREAYLNVAWNTARYELPLSAISGTTQVVVNKNIDDDSLTQALTGVIASSMARGIAWNLYSEASNAITLSGIKEGKANPYQIAAELVPQSEAHIIIERLEGNLPPLDSREFVIVDTTYSGMKQEDVETYISKFKKLLPENESFPSLSPETSLDEIKGLISDRLDRDEQMQAEFEKQEDLNKQYLAFRATKEYVGIREAKDGEQGFSMNPTIELGSADENGIYRVGRSSPGNKLRVDTYTVVKTPDGEVIPVGDNLNLSQGLTIDDKGQINITGIATYNGQPVEVHHLPVVPGLSQTIMGSLSQGLFEFGWQSLAMGLPATKGGSMSSYAWGNYVQSLSNLTGAAGSSVSRGGGLFNTMNNYAASVGKDVTERNILTTLSDIPLFVTTKNKGDIPLVNEVLGIAPFIAVSGYKDMPFSVVAQVETGFKAEDTIFYPYWPYQRMSVVPHENFWRSIKIGTAKQISGQTIVPENGDNKENNVQSENK